MFYVYILQSLKDKNFYIGQSNNLKERIKRHNCGLVRSTKHRRPFKLVYFETYKDRNAAYKREREIKRMKGGVQFRELIRSSNGHRKAGSRSAGIGQGPSKPQI
jgi:putative endonuclease